MLSQFLFMIDHCFWCWSYLAELILTFDVRTFVETLSLLNAEKEATSGSANTMKLTMLFIFLLPNASKCRSWVWSYLCRLTYIIRSNVSLNLDKKSHIFPTTDFLFLHPRNLYCSTSWFLMGSENEKLICEECYSLHSTLRSPSCCHSTVESIIELLHGNLNWDVHFPPYLRARVCQQRSNDCDSILKSLSLSASRDAMKAPSMYCYGRLFCTWQMAIDE